MFGSQVSTPVQKRRSSQASSTGICLQTSLKHWSIVHAMPSSQSGSGEHCAHAGDGADETASIARQASKVEGRYRPPRIGEPVRRPVVEETPAGLGEGRHVRPSVDCRRSKRQLRSDSCSWRLDIVIPPFAEGSTCTAPTRRWNRMIDQVPLSSTSFREGSGGRYLHPEALTRLSMKARHDAGHRLSPPSVWTGALGAAELTVDGASATRGYREEMR